MEPAARLLDPVLDSLLKEDRSMSIRSKLKELGDRLRHYRQGISKSRDDLADGVSAENVLPPIPPDKPRPDPRRRRSA